MLSSANLSAFSWLNSLAAGQHQLDWAGMGWDATQLQTIEHSCGDSLTRTTSGAGPSDTRGEAATTGSGGICLWGMVPWKPLRGFLASHSPPEPHFCQTASGGHCLGQSFSTIWTHCGLFYQLQKILASSCLKAYYSVLPVFCSVKYRDLTIKSGKKLNG